MKRTSRLVTMCQGEESGMDARGISYFASINNYSEFRNAHRYRVGSGIMGTEAGYG
jgi:hypothetical protein